MDAVILYVDMDDPKWKEEHDKYCGYKCHTIRFRDWGFLKYVMRGIETYMPFIDRIHLVVMMDSQVPEWINREKVNIVYHEDIIPQKYLPLFNSSSLEMFIHKIPGLSEEFLYFNDDFFPTQMLEYSDFFDGNGNIYNKMKDEGLREGYYLKSTIFSTQLAAALSGKEIDENYWLVPQHTIAPMIRSSQEFVYSQLESILLNGITKFRTARNTHQYLFTNYLYFSGKLIEKELPFKMLFTALTTIDEVKESFFNENIKTICINDWGDFEGLTYDESRKILDVIMQEKYPNKSEYEK